MPASSIAFCQFVRFLTGGTDYVPARDYQNFWPNQSYSFEGVSYLFAPFRLGGNTVSRGGDISESSIVTVPNDLTVGILTEAVQQRWLVQTKTCLLSGPTTPTDNPVFTVAQTLTSEIWSANSLSHETEVVRLNLATPLNLTQAQFPRRVLTTDLVGPLPATGNIFAR